ncbi:Crp/Fnr family transcriptional regulator [Paenibacillus sp. NPDC058177]|uniref:Crp/Fnr family transcriptional regulator n=1 Tax=Paenibacillus sp. NPDC058177 TaxID=3346369 RepID=UPI0036D90127
MSRDIVIHIGDEPTEIYFVVSGILRSYYIDISGDDKTQLFINENSFYANEYFLDMEPSKCCVEALEDCTVLVVEWRDLVHLLESNVYCMKAYIKALEYSIRYKIGRENSFLLKSATERYLDFKKKYVHLEKRVNQSYIASYLGITPVSLSRIRRTIKDEN